VEICRGKPTGNCGRVTERESINSSDVVLPRPRFSPVLFHVCAEAFHAEG